VCLKSRFKLIDASSARERLGAKLNAAKRIVGKNSIDSRSTDRPLRKSSRVVNQEIPLNTMEA